MSEPYRLRMAPSAVRAMTSGLSDVATVVYGFANGPLLDGPGRIGKPSDPPLAPTWSARRGTYRVLYLIDDRRRCLTVTSVRHRADAHRT